MQFQCQKQLYFKFNITFQFNISTQFWPIGRQWSGATTLGQSGPGSEGSEGVLCIPQSSCITGTSPLDCLVSYPGHSLGESYPSAEKQSVYSTAPADWATPDRVLSVMVMSRISVRNLFIEVARALGLLAFFTIFHNCRVGGKQDTQHGSKPENSCVHAQHSWQRSLR